MQLKSYLKTILTLKNVPFFAVLGNKHKKKNFKFALIALLSGQLFKVLLHLKLLKSKSIQASVFSFYSHTAFRLSMWPKLVLLIKE